MEAWGEKIFSLALFQNICVFLEENTSLLIAGAREKEMWGAEAGWRLGGSNPFLILIFLRLFVFVEREMKKAGWRLGGSNPFQFLFVLFFIFFFCWKRERDMRGWGSVEVWRKQSCSKERRRGSGCGKNPFFLLFSMFVCLFVCLFVCAEREKEIWGAWRKQSCSKKSRRVSGWGRKATNCRLILLREANYSAICRN